MQQGSDSPSQASPAPQPDMRKWQFSREFLNEGTPSRKDNISLKKESSQRRLALSFGQDVGFLLKMNQYTIATAAVYWQRFFTVQSLAKNDPYLIATACLLLAGKVEENFKSLQKITETAYFVRSKKDPKAAEALRSNQRLLVAEMDRVVKAEEVLLMMMNFEFFVSHPYRPLLTMVKEAGFTPQAQNSQDTSARQVCQVAWNFANDSFRTTICLQPVSSVDLAAACLNLAANTLKVKIPSTEDGKPWWSRWKVNPEVLHDVEFQVMSLYRNKKDGDSKTSPTSRISLPATPSLQAASREPQATGTPSPTSPGDPAAATAAPAAPSTSGAAATGAAPPSDASTPSHTAQAQTHPQDHVPAAKEEPGASHTGASGPEHSAREASAAAAGAGGPLEPSEHSRGPCEEGEGRGGDRGHDGAQKQGESAGRAEAQGPRGAQEGVQGDVDMELSDGETGRWQASSKADSGRAPLENPSASASTGTLSQGAPAPSGQGVGKLQARATAADTATNGTGAHGDGEDEDKDKDKDKDKDSLLGLSEELMSELEDVDVEGGKARSSGARLLAKRRRHEEGGGEAGWMAAEKLPRVREAPSTGEAPAWEGVTGGARVEK